MLHTLMSLACKALTRRSLMLVVLAVQSPLAAHATELWFAPGDDLNVKGTVNRTDFQELFVPGSPWQTGLSRINVLQIRSPWFLRMPEAAVKQVISFSVEHRIGLAVPLDSVASDTCGQNVEGFTSTKGMQFYPRELRKRGVPLEYVVLDEPLYYGHEYSTSTTCNFPIQEVAKRVAYSIRTVKSYYPAIKVVLSEPEQSLSGGVVELAEFLDAYRRELGEYPSAMRMDIQWHKDWPSAIPSLLSMLRSRHVGFSLIYNATRGGLAPSDSDWVRSAEANVQTYRSRFRQPPNQIVIQSWDKRPGRVLPESDPTTMTGFLKWYISVAG